MINDNKVNNWLAETKEGNLITIDKAVNGIDYYCYDCKQILHSRALTSELIRPHFYHLNNNKITNCSCLGAYKRYWRDKLINIAEIITLPYLNDITCISKEINYKINDNFTGDIYIKDDKGNNILFVFDRIEEDQQNLAYTIYYINVMNLELDKSNFNNCIELLHSEKVEKLNNILKSKIDLLIEEYRTNIKEEYSICKADINKFKELQNDLAHLNYSNEYILLSQIINSLEGRKKAIYKYKNNIISLEEIQQLKTLINKVLKITKLNINQDINIIKRLDYNIYKTTWNKLIYFNFIKPISTALKIHIKDMEQVINN